VVLLLAGAAALLGLVVLGGLAPARYRDVLGRVADGTGAAAPRAVAWITVIVLAVGVAAAVAMVLPR
jgi:putative membrane protein